MNKFLKIYYFSWLHEHTGSAQEELAVPQGVETVGALMDYLSTLDVPHATAFRNRETIRCAINREFADPWSSVQPGDEIAFFPPMTGG